MTRTLLTVPNQLTIFRMLLVPVFITFMIYKWWKLALLTFFIAAVTDVLDGYFARRLNQKTALGAALDPLSDKVLMDSAFLVLSEQGLVPPWLAVVVISRDVLMVGGVVLLKLFGNGNLKIEPILAGKLTTFFQVLTVLAVLLSKVKGNPPEVLLRILYIVTLIFTVTSGYLYYKRGREFLNSGGKGGEGSAR